MDSEAALGIAIAALRRIAECVDAPEEAAPADWQWGRYCRVEGRDQGADYGYAVGVAKARDWAASEAFLALKAIGNKGAP